MSEGTKKQRRTWTPDEKAEIVLAGYAVIDRFVDAATQSHRREADQNARLAAKSTRPGSAH